MFATSSQGERFEVRENTMECYAGGTCEVGPYNVQMNGSNYETWYCKEPSEEAIEMYYKSQWVRLQKQKRVRETRNFPKCCRKISQVWC